MTGMLAKVVVVLVLLVGALGFMLKEEIYQGGLRDAALITVAEASERSIETERMTGRSLVAVTRAQAEGDARLSDQRRRADAAEAEAKAARAAERAARAAKPQPAACPPPPKEPTQCDADLPVRQP